MTKQKPEDEQPPTQFSSPELARKAQGLIYPVKPDGRGQARVYWGGKNFNFGEHGSDSSWLKFARWKDSLLETGKPTQVRSIRIDPAHERAPDSVVTPGQSPIALVALTAVVALVLGSGGTALLTNLGKSEISSTATTVSDDASDIPFASLPKFQQQLIAGIQAQFARLTVQQQEAKAKMLLKMTNWAEQGRANEPPHITLLREQIAKWEEQQAEDPEGHLELTRGIYARRGIKID